MLHHEGSSLIHEFLCIDFMFFLQPACFLGLYQKSKCMNVNALKVCMDMILSILN